MIAPGPDRTSRAAAAVLVDQSDAPSAVISARRGSNDPAPRQTSFAVRVGSPYLSAIGFHSVTKMLFAL